MIYADGGINHGGSMIAFDPIGSDAIVRMSLAGEPDAR
jgi:hypothetical protein